MQEIVYVKVKRERSFPKLVYFWKANITGPKC